MFTGGNFASIAPRTRYVLSSELRLFQKGYLGHALFHPRPNLKGSSLRKLHTGAAPCRHQIIRKDQRGFAVKTHARVQPLGEESANFLDLSVNLELLYLTASLNQELYRQSLLSRHFIPRQE